MDLTQITGHETVGAAAAASGGTLVTGHASANTESAWTELIAATASRAAWITVFISSNTQVGRYLIDIGTGAAASETVLLPDLHFENAAATNSAAVYTFPVNIPAGTRISARFQSSTGLSQIRVMAILAHGPDDGLTPPGVVHAYGTSAADSGLTNIDPGGTANTDSAWVEITASTTDDIRWLVLGFGHDAAGITVANTRWLVDVATGAAASEVEILSDVAVYGSVNDDSPNPRSVGFAVDIPAGTRLAVRARCASNAATNRLLDVALYGADAAVPTGGGGGGGGQHAHASWS